MAEPKRMMGKTYAGRRRQYMSDGLPYNTHNWLHFIERWGMKNPVTREVRADEMFVGVYAETPARMATAVIVSRS